MLDDFQPEVQIDEKKVVRNAAIARLAKFIDQHLYHIDWTILADTGGVGHILNASRHERVRRAQRFGDPDYPSAIVKFLKEVFDANEQIGLFLVGQIALGETPGDDKLSGEGKEELAEILSMFSNEDVDALIPAFPTTVAENLIEVTRPPDNFYDNLIDEINRAYAYQMPMALSVLIRKLLENLVIDVLRAKYGTSDLRVYYDPSRRRFNSFSVLLRNLDARKSDFHYITPSLDKSFIRRLDQYRETGNSGAHSVDVNLTTEQFKAEKSEINYLVRLLLRIFHRL